MTKSVERTALQAVSVAGMVICVLVALWGWQSGILTSQERLALPAAAAPERCCSWCSKRCRW